MTPALIETPAKTNSLLSRLEKFGRFVIALLNELSDQTAYQRHLAIHGASDSPAEWRKFSDEHWRKQSRRGRCC